MIFRMGKQVSSGLEHIADITAIFFFIILREKKKCAVHEVIAGKIIHFLSQCHIHRINNKFCLGWFRSEFCIRSDYPILKEPDPTSGYSWVNVNFFRCWPGLSPAWISGWVLIISDRIRTRHFINPEYLLWELCISILMIVYAFIFMQKRWY